MARYTPSTTQELRQLVRDPQIHLGDIDVSNITDFSFLFADPLDQDYLKLNAYDRYNYAGIETWNVSRAITMQGMFAGCRYFNVDLSKWDVSKVENMASMFEGCVLFNQPLTLKTNCVTDVSRMFKDCDALNSPITLDLARVTAYEDMFLGAREFKPESMLHIPQPSNPDAEDSPLVNSLESASYFLKRQRHDHVIGKYVPQSVAELRILLSTGITLAQIDARNLTSLRGAFCTGAQYAKIAKEEENPHLPLIIDLVLDSWDELQSWDVSHIRDFSYCFAGQQDLAHVPFTQLTNAQNCEYMFADCWSLTKIDFRNLTTNDIDVTHLANNTGVVFTKNHKFKHEPQQELYEPITELDIAQQIALRTLRVGDKYVPTSLQELRILVHNNPQIDFAQIDTCKLTTLASAFAKDLVNENKAEHQANPHLPTISSLQCLSWKNLASLQVSHIKDFSYCFSGQTTFNTDISHWNTSHAVTMHGMFERCEEFNQPVHLDTAQVTDMSLMFHCCAQFNQPVHLDTAQVTDMSFMFSHCAQFNQPVHLDTAQVTDMRWMFNDCAQFNQPVHLNTAQVTDMSYMFSGCAQFNQRINFDTDQVTDMSYMFSGCAQFNQRINFDTAQVTNMWKMFSGCVQFNQRINFDTAQVTNMSSMFSGCAQFNQRINFNTAQVTYMSYMFSGCAQFNQRINFNTAQVIDISCMFNGCAQFNQPVHLNTAQVTNMRGMFKGCERFNQRINFDTAQVTDMREMFSGCENFNQNLSFEISQVQVEGLTSMFYD